MDSTLLSTHLALCVPIEMDNVRRSGVEVDAWLIRQAQERMTAFRKPNMSEAVFLCLPETREAVTILTECLAILAYQPGGITFLNTHFEAREGVPAFARVPLQG